MKTGRNSRHFSMKKLEKIGHDNRGISITELLVVIMILAVLSSGVIMMVGTVSGWHVRQCADSITAVMSETRIQAMSKTAASMTIKFDGKDSYIIDKSFGNEETVGSSRITITYSDSTGNTGIDVKKHPLSISYDRSSGVFLPIGTDSGGNPIYCNEITVKQGRHVKAIKLYQETGRYQIID